MQFAPNEYKSLAAPAIAVWLSAILLIGLHFKWRDYNEVTGMLQWQDAHQRELVDRIRILLNSAGLSEQEVEKWLDDMAQLLEAADLSSKGIRQMAKYPQTGGVRPTHELVAGLEDPPVGFGAQNRDRPSH
jgi:hypothetical protein